MKAMLFLALFATDVEQIRMLPSSDQCSREVDFYSAKLADASKRGLDDVEARRMVGWWITASLARGEGVFTNPGNRREPYPISLIERLALVRHLWSPPK